MLPKKQQFSLGGPLALLKATGSKTMEYCAREAQQIFGGLGFPLFSYDRKGLDLDNNFTQVTHEEAKETKWRGCRAKCVPMPSLQAPRRLCST